MQTNQMNVTLAAVVGIVMLASPVALSQLATIPSNPIGAISATPTIVQAGARPALSWAIRYPSKVSDILLVNPPGTLVPNQDVYVTVQIVGTGLTSCDPSAESLEFHTEARISLNGGAYVQLFYGTQFDVDSAKPLFIKRVLANQTIDFGGRYVLNGAWSPFYTTRSANFQVVALTDGDIPPTLHGLDKSSTSRSYLKPYLDASGKVRIGPMSVLVMMELNQTNHNMTCFDLQDQVLLVSFSTKHPNNGHGNNLDGVDCSNPGAGHGGPNGTIDPSGGIDDEIR